MAAMQDRGRPPKLGRMLERGESIPSDPTELLEILRAPKSVPEFSQCMNPGCSNEVAWRSGKGAQGAFCSDACRRTFRGTRLLLLAEIEHIEGALRHGQMIQLTERALRSELYKRRWHLARYPDAILALRPTERDPIRSRANPRA